MDLLVTFWMPLVAAAILGGSVSIGSAPAREAHILARARLVLGAALGVTGMTAALGGLGSMWVASLEELNVVPGAIVFVAGAIAAFAGIGLATGRAPRTRRR